MASRTKSQRAGVLAVALLAGSSVRLDDIYYRRPLDQWQGVDWIIGLLLAISAGVAVIGALRLIESRAQIRELARRTSGIADAAWVVSRGGHMGAVLDRVAEEACNVTGAERATICVLDRDDPRTVSVVAGHRSESLVGKHFGIDEGLMRDVFIAGEPVACEDCRDFGVVAAKAEQRPGAAAPIRFGDEVRGTLAVVGKREAPVFEETELELLTRLADLAAVALEQTEMHERIEIAHASGVDALTAAIDLHDSYTWEHSESVMALADLVARRLGFDEAALAEITVAARLHDVGKIGVPDAILLKPGPLDPEEWDVMRSCPRWGAEMIERFPRLGNVASLVRSMHEHWDGGGYPAGIAGEDIPLASRVLLACDAYDAMTRDRPWRQAFEPWVAARQLRRGAGHQFDAMVVDALIGALRESRVSTPFAGLAPASGQRTRAAVQPSPLESVPVPARQASRDGRPAAAPSSA
jgi:HD-GYP domain-containing protein (c-di-GMP phosphodiesterase class II)